MRKKRIIVTVAIVILTIIIVNIPTQESLVFYKENTNDIAAFLPVESDSKFNIVWTHSIHLKDVIEKYQVTHDFKIHQYEIVFEEFGIGMPSNALEGETFTHEDGQYHVKNLKNYFDEINLRNGKTVSKHRLQYGKDLQHELYFNDFFERGAWFTVKVDKISLFKSWKEVKLHD